MRRKTFLGLLAEYNRFMQAKDEDAREPCEYGHLGCSYREGGPCFDEFLSIHPEFE